MGTPVLWSGGIERWTVTVPSTEVASR